MRLAFFLLIPGLLWTQELQNVTGRVVDTLTKGPVGNAIVMLQGNGTQPQVLTDSFGQFTFSEVPAGTYTLFAMRSGEMLSNNHVMFNLQAGASPKPFELTLNPSALLTGAVTGDAGLPVPYAGIQVFRRGVNEGEKVLMPIGANVNDLGEFRIPHLQPGRYLVCASAPVSRYKQLHHTAYKAACFPESIDADLEQWIDLQPGSTRNLELSLELVHSIRVAGNTRGADDESPFFTLRKLDDPDSLRGLDIVWDNKLGTFTIPSLTTGDYLLTGHVIRDQREYSASRILHADEKDIMGVVVDLSNPASLTGSVSFEGEAPSTEGQPVVAPSLSVYQQKLQLFAPTGGNFRAPVPAPGSYRLVVQAPPGYYAKSASMGGRSVLDRPIAITSDYVPPLDVVYAKGGGALHLHFETTTPKALTAVKPVLLVRNAEGKGYLTSGISVPAIETDYEVPNVPPGEYVLFIAPNDPDLEYMNPTWLSKHESEATPITVQDGQTARITIRN